MTWGRVLRMNVRSAAGFFRFGTATDAKVVWLPPGRWRDDLGEEHIGPKELRLENVPISRLPRYERL